MKNVVVRDIMVPLEEYPCIPHTLTLGDAIREMTVQIRKGRQVSLARVALVFDEDFTDLQGLLRRRDIMRGLEPGFLAGGPLDYQRKLFDVTVDPNLCELSDDKIIERLRQRARMPVAQFMIPIPATIEEDAHIMKAMCEMVDKNTSLLPVLRNTDVVGVVRSVDVMNELALIV
jgi:CBS domain-containing protein